MTEQKNFYITTPIYYVNDVPHIGHAYTSIACDAIARFKRLQDQKVYFLTGTDEHGQKVQKSALDRGKTPQQYCDEISAKFRELAQILQISNDDFIRTTEERHKKVVEFFWKKLQENGWIYKGVYEGWYSIRDEAFYQEEELIDGKAPTGAEVVWQKEESYFFKLSEFQDKLLQFYEQNPHFIQPQSRRNEVISFVRGGKEYQKGALKDLSVSRTSFDWGIKVPNDEKHVIYVWLDALVNYLSALNFAAQDQKLYQNFWENSLSLHIVGKDILRFHAVYWPAFLMAAQLPLPTEIFAHGWWTNEGQKISKSVGNVIDPIKELEWLQSFNVSCEISLDYFRYFLLKEVPFGNDGDYSRQNLINRVNSEIVNNIGNLLQRSASMLYKEGGEISNYCKNSQSEELLAKCFSLGKMPQDFNDLMNQFKFDLAINDVLNVATLANSFVEQNAPWTLKKEGKIDEMKQVLSTVLEVVRCIAITLQPFCINGSKKILDILNISQDQRQLKHISQEFALKAGHKINQPEIVFPRLNVK